MRGYVSTSALQDIASLFQVPEENVILWPVYTNYDLLQQKAELKQNSLSRSRPTTSSTKRKGNVLSK